MPLRLSCGCHESDCFSCGSTDQRNNLPAALSAVGNNGYRARDLTLDLTDLPCSEPWTNAWRLTNKQRHQRFIDNVIFPRVCHAAKCHELFRCNNTMATDRMRAPQRYRLPGTGPSGSDGSLRRCYPATSSSRRSHRLPWLQESMLSRRSSRSTTQL